MISLIRVGREYRRGRWGLRDVSFSLGRGEFAFLTGSSGAGKTSLMRLLSFEDQPTTGEVVLENYSSRNIRRRDLPYLRRRIGVVFQDFRLLPDRTAYENVAIVLRATGARRKGLHRRVVRALAGVGLAGRGDAMPSELSGGEQQRIGIARAIVNDPFAVLADEPTGNLDEPTAREIFRLLRKVATGGTAVLIATHDIGLAREFRVRILRLEEGRLVEDATTAPSEGPLVDRRTATETVVREGIPT